MRPIETWLVPATAAEPADFGRSHERDLGQTGTHKDFASLMETTLGSFSKNHPGKIVSHHEEGSAHKASNAADKSSPPTRSGKFCNGQISGEEKASQTRPAANHDISGSSNTPNSTSCENGQTSSTSSLLPSLSTMPLTAAGEPAGVASDSAAPQAQAIPSTPLHADASATLPAQAEGAGVVILPAAPSAGPGPRTATNRSTSSQPSASLIVRAASPAIVSDSGVPAARAKRPDGDAGANLADTKSTAPAPAELREPSGPKSAKDDSTTRSPQTHAALFLTDASDDQSDPADMLASAQPAGYADLPADAIATADLATSTDAIDGTGVAFNDSPMKNPKEENKVAGPAVKVLPVDDQTGASEKNLPPQMLVTSPHGTNDQGGNLNHGFGGGSDASSVENHARISNTFDLPTLADARMRALDRAHDMMALHSMRLVESKLDMLSVVIKPAVGVELSLDLHQNGGGVDAEATLLRGDHQFLNQHWSELQQRLEERGIKLAALNYDTGSPANDGGQHQPQQPSQEEAAQQASAFAEFAAAQQGGATARLATAHDGWEFWA